MAPTAAQVLERVFTSDNPSTGSKPPPAMAWVVFANGTCFFCAPSDDVPVTASRDELEAAARAALIELGPVMPGSSSADFNPARLDGWYPDEPVWFVGFDHEAIATIVVEDGTDLAVGMHARSLREADHAAPVVTLVRGFDGTVWT